MKRIGMEQWLSAYGFKGNPFANREAGSERLLNQYFVAPSYFDEILGTAHSPQTALVFAPRGGGKTAQRVMVDYHCRKRLFQGQVLSVLHTDFTSVVEEAEGDLSKISVRSHVNEILRRTVVALCDYITSNPGSIRSIHEMSDRERVYIMWFIHKYKNYLIPRKIDALDETGVKLLSLEEYRNAGLTDFLAEREHMPPPELLANFSDLIHILGIDALYVLVDRVDEFLLTAADPIGAVNLVEPLLADLTIMNLPRIAFKFFLPQQLEEIIKSRSSIRQDRLIFRRIEWTEFALQEVLHKRLEAFSSYSDMDAVCVPELRGRIEKEMIELADRSPRSLIRLGSLLLAEHCELPMPDNQDEWLITEKAWEEAQKKFAAEKVNQWGISDPKPDVVQSELIRKNNNKLDSDDIRLLIKGGENSKLEFKSTMRWSLHTNKPEKEVELSWLKTIAAFLNTDGGILLIGIEDNGGIIGIKYDNFENEDKCLRHFNNLVKHHIGLEFLKYITFSFNTINEKRIIVIRCNSSKTPVFFKHSSGQDFYIRSGSSSEKLQMSEMLKHLENKM